MGDGWGGGNDLKNGTPAENLQIVVTAFVGDVAGVFCRADGLWSSEEVVIISGRHCNIKESTPFLNT